MSPEFAIITPLVEEWDAVCRKLEGAQKVGSTDLKGIRGQVGAHEVVCFQTGRGENVTAAVVTRIVKAWRPHWVLLVGIAGGLGESELGDVVIASHVIAYDYGKVEEGRFVHRPEYDFSPDKALLLHARHRAKDAEAAWVAHITTPRPEGSSSPRPVVRVVGVASGDKVDDDTRHGFLAEVRTMFPELGAIEMEGAGCAASVWAEASRRPIGFLMIRGISDVPDRPRTSAGSEQRAVWERYAAAAAAAFATDFIGSFTKGDDRWEALLDRLLDKRFNTITGREQMPARKLIEKAFEINLEVTPTSGKFPAIVDLDRLDPDILLEARLLKERAFDRRVPISSGELELLDLYQEPSNYGQMIERLKADNLLIICGEAGVGKSISALRTVQDFFQLGLRPIIPPLPTPTMSAWEKVKKTVRSEIVYLDDPFGKTSFIAPDPPDQLIDILLEFMDGARQGETGYLVISTRTNVFDAFLNQASAEARERLKARRIVLGLENYSVAFRHTLFERYARRYGCQWFRPAQQVTMERIIAAASATIELPLNIKHFCDETDNVVDPEALMARIVPYSVAPAQRYASQLRDAGATGAMYLVFAKYLKGGFLNKKNLQNLFEELPRPDGQREWTWETCERYFRSWFAWEASGRCRVTHPSIDEAILKYFVEDESAQAQLNAVFANLLNRDDDDARAGAAIGMPQSIGQLTPELKSALQALQQDASALVRTSLAQALATYIPDQTSADWDLFASVLQGLLADPDPAVRAGAMSSIYSNARRCGSELQKAASSLKNDAAAAVRRQLAWAVATNFKVVHGGRSILKELAIKDPDQWVRIGTGEAMADNLESLQDDDDTMALLKDLTRGKNPEISRAMLGALEYNFVELPPDFKTIFLEKAREPDFSIIEWVIWFVGNKFTEVHEAFVDAEQKTDDLHRRLRRFAKHPDATVRKWLAEALGANLENLDDICADLLKDLVEDRSPLVRDAACGYYSGSS